VTVSIYLKKYALLTKPLLAHLKEQGYTHILKEGPNEEAQEYYLRPLKDGSGRPFVENINDDEFADMANGMPLIDFYIALPVCPALKYGKSS